MKDKKVLITGAGGFIGSHLTEELSKIASRVKVFVHYNSRNDYGLLNNLDKDIKDSLEIVFSDITDSVAVNKAMKDVDIVYHLAALIGIPYSYYSPNSYVETNIKGTMNILNAGRELGVSKVVHTSTSEVYGTALYTPIDENHPLQAQSPYSASKIAADKLAESYYLSFDLPVTIIRPFNTFGPRQSLRAVIPTIISQAIDNKVIKLGNTSTVRDFNYVKDTVEGFIKVSNYADNNGQVTNIGSGVAVSVNQVLEIIGKVLNRDLIVEIEESRFRPEKSEVYKLICNSKKAKTQLNWEPKYTLEEGIIETINWFKNNSSNIKSDKYIW